MHNATITPTPHESRTPKADGVRLSFLASIARGAAVSMALFGAVACSDGPTAPIDPGGSIDGAAILPAVQDARIRLVPAIQNVGVRDRVKYDLLEIEKALATHDAQKVRYHVRIAGGILIDYRAGLAGIVTDGPDVGGVGLALYAVAVAAGGTFNIAALK